MKRATGWVVFFSGWQALAATVPAILDSSFGYRLPGRPECAVWWCESTYKVGRERALPEATADRVHVEAARNEYEPFQLVLYPEHPLAQVRLRIPEAWVHTSQASVVLAATNIEVRLVDYVPVQFPSDAGGSSGLYPDPLLPMPPELALEARRQQPFWITVYVPKTQPAGLYLGAIEIEAQGWSEPIRVPVQLRVFNFTLPDFTHTRTLYDVAIPSRWHGPLNEAQRAQVWDLYMENFRRHRVSPQMPQRYAPLRWSWGAGQFVYDFADYDRALTRYLDEFGFSSFVFMDEPWTLFGFSRFQPGYNSLFTLLMSGIAEHLRRKGWMEKACAYWIDEPADSLIPFVRTGMHAHLYAVPDLKRLLTREPVPELYGLVDLWVPMAVLSIFRDTADRWFDRMATGEEVWWYVCTYPKWPVPNYFIDHPAITHRIRFWLAERYGIHGDLYWDVNWYLDRQHQPIDPWTQTTVLDEWGQPMGNGDGVLLYPPVRTPPDQPVVAGPIDSLRWELIREGLEDREYFWLLRELGRRAALRLGPEHPAVTDATAARAQALAVASELTNYTHDPRELLGARRVLARALESLSTPEPFWVEEPSSRVVNIGDALVLRCEALGWPPPVYHWYKDGIPMGTTDEGLWRIIAADVNTPGDYWVVASNVAGTVTSRVARIRGNWTSRPEIVVPPSARAVRLGNPMVLAVVGVGEPPLRYMWLKDGEPVPSDGPAGPTFLRSNTVPADAGFYQVMVSNAWGTVTSAPVRVAVHWDLLRQPVVPRVSSWRYDNRGVALPTDWFFHPERNENWQTGQAPFGSGFSDAATSLAREDGTLPATAYFFTTFELHDPTGELEGQIACDDGAVVFLNGHEVLRLNMPPGAPSYGTSAQSPVDGSPLRATFFIAPELLQSGTNLLAVQLHQHAEPLQPPAVWPFDEPGPPWERLGGGLGWTAVGTGVVATAGRWLGCVSNAASSDSWLELPHDSGLQPRGPFTVGGWFAWGSGLVNTATRTAIEKAGEYRLYYTGNLVNRYRFRLGEVEVQEQTPGTRVGQWRLVMAWFDGTNACIQMDNGPVYSAPAQLPPVTTNPVVALRLDPGAGGFAADDLFFFPRALTAEERAAIYQLGIRRFLTNLATAREDLWFELELNRLLGSPPQFLAGPESQVRVAGEPVGFELTAVGTAPIQYQWLFEGLPIPGATGTRLYLPQVSEAHAGLYALMATNRAGAAISPPARLSVLSRPQLDFAWDDALQRWRLWLPQLSVPTTLQVSTNLVDWESVWMRPAESPATYWSLPTRPGRPVEFYRLQIHR